MNKIIEFETRTIADFDRLYLELNKIDKDAWNYASPAKNSRGDTLIDVDDNSVYYDKFIKLKAKF
ncbi:hypothetical protein FOH24_16790 [Acetobacter tropicalis]|uniref:hypothetical protein n=1 Tax=Acetobacter tropicalis TaxID=104102 RepID=UPI0005584290|nr:hypothetical protein [Acetobacter tropicalis]KAA8383731.1 hypothetical protein FOH22_16440 [Acetobacter tropicalis]KAA8384185.1 hypothetical protein FOH24_16790 [Acetobacter tropicalis]MBC9009975.1 hypothetical protein [Acetobacter tropicalis]MDO8171655.1 hypothetical protein [Acetobacter tropicalis]